jgi:hypothetical protein
MVKSIRPPAGEDERKDWLVRFDYSSFMAADLPSCTPVRPGR